MVNNKTNKSKQRNAGVVEQKSVTGAAATSALTTAIQCTGPKQKHTTATNNHSNKNGSNNKKVNTNNTQNNATVTTQQKNKNNNSNNNNNNGKQSNQGNNTKTQQQRKSIANTNSNYSNNNNNGGDKDNNLIKSSNGGSGSLQQSAKIVAIAANNNSCNNTTTTFTNTNHNLGSTYAETVGLHNNNKTRTTRIYTNSNSINNKKSAAVGLHKSQTQKSDNAANADDFDDDSFEVDSVIDLDVSDANITSTIATPMSASDLLTAALTVPCAKCSKTTAIFAAPAPVGGRQYRKSKSYVGGGEYSGRTSVMSVASVDSGHHGNGHNKHNNNGRHHYHRSYSDRRSSFDRNFAERNKDFVPIAPPPRPVLSSSNIAAVITDVEKLVIIERLGKGRISYPIMQCGTLDAPDSSYHQQRSNRMDVYQIDDGFHSDGGTETPPPSPSSGSSIASASDHGSLESVDTGGTQRLAVLSFEQVRKLHDVMDEKVAIHGRGNFPTLEVTLKDLVNLVRRKLEADVNAGGAGVIVKDVRLNGGAASHVLASEDQPYNDLDLIYAIELSSSRHFDRVKTAVLNTLLDLLPEGVSKRRIMPCALKEAYVGKMVKVNNNNDGDRWSLISLGNSPGHKNVELKFVDTMRRQFEFSVDSFQIVLDSLLLFYDCAALPISENFYPTVVGESVYGDFQEALYHLQKKLISTRQPEEIRGGGLLKYCNLLVRNYKPVDPQRIKTLERYMCSRFFIDFPDITTQTVKLEAYLRNHFWGVDEEPLQYKYLMHLREVVEMSTVCLMGHERRQTLLLIQSLAAQVLYKEQQKQQQAQEQYHQQQHQHQQQQQQVDLQKQQQQQTVTLVSTQQQQLVQQPQTIYVQQAPPPPQTTTICCAALTTTSEQQSAAQQQQQQVQVQVQPQATAASVPQTIQLQAGPPGLIYNGVFYAPVLPAAICTCNSTWLST